MIRVSKTIKYACENCGRTYMAIKKNKVILCEKCKTDLYRTKQKEKYIAKEKENNFFFQKHQRNKEIIRLFDEGKKIVAISKIYNISSTRVRQILQARREKIWDIK